MTDEDRVRKDLETLANKMDASDILKDQPEALGEIARLSKQGYHDFIQEFPVDRMRETMRRTDMTIESLAPFVGRYLLKCAQLAKTQGQADSLHRIAVECWGNARGNLPVITEEQVDQIIAIANNFEEIRDA